MRRSLEIRSLISWALCALSLGAVCLAWAAPPEAGALSKVVPAEDLIKQANLYIAGIEKVLATEEAYRDENRKVTKDAHTLAVLAQLLAKYDQDHALRSAAPALVAASQKLAKTEDLASAKAAFAEVQAALAGTAAGPEVEWKPVASMGQLMKQVTFVNNRLRRNLRKFEARADDNALDTAVLAAIAQSVTYDTHEVKDPALTDQWYELSREWRDSAGQLNAAVHARDAAGADKALARMTKSCEDCHKVFRRQ